MKCTGFMYKAKNVLLIYYFWNITSWKRLPIFATPYLNSHNCQNLSAARLDMWWQFHVEYHCAVPLLFEQLLCTFSFKYAYRKKSGIVRFSKVQVTGYPIHANALRLALTRYRVYRSILTEQVLKWHDIISAPVPLSEIKSAFWNV